MRKLSFSKGVSTTLVAMALVTGLAVPVYAAIVDTTLSQQEVTKSGATILTAAPQISMKESVAEGQHVSSWTVNYTPVPEAVKDANGNTVRNYYTRIFVFDKGDRTKPLNGSYYIDSNGKRVLTGGKYIDYVNPYANPNTKYETTISTFSLTPGTKEIVAMMFDAAGYQADYNAALANDTEDTISEADYMVASNAIEVTVSNEAYVSTSVTSTSVQLSLGSAGKNTGYEIYRKVGKKYQKIATVASDVYTDKGLLSKTTYSYKVRPYDKNTETNAVVYGKEKTIEATTKGSALNLVVKINNKNKPHLTWKKVAGAKQYEIYRADTSSYTSSVSKGLTNSYTTYKKIATVKKSKKKYVDKKVSGNRSYYYIVRAVIAKDKKVKGDKDSYVQQSGGAYLVFDSVSPQVTYTSATGDKTVTWAKVYGAKSYIVEKYAYNAQNDTYDWTTVQTLGKNATKTVLPAEVTMKADNTTVKSTSTDYRIKAFNGTSYSEASQTFTTYKEIGTVQKVTAKQVANGIQVSWTPVAGAAYYRVYRVKSDSVANNKDIGGYDLSGGAQVTEYVGVQTPVAVDVAGWNTAVDQSVAAYKANPNANYSDYLHESDKLNDKKTYHYQNYSYSRDVFDANTTSILDYFGDIYEGNGYYYVKNSTTGADGKTAVTEWSYYYNPVVTDDRVQKSGTGSRPQAGVDYTYYVVAVQATAKAATDYNGYGNYNTDYYYTQATVQSAYNTAVTGPQANDSAYAVSAPSLDENNFKNVIGSTSGVKQYGRATYTNTVAVKTAPKIKSVKASKGKVTLKLKKKIKAADYYKIYRATKKKGKYTVAGVTKNAKTISFKDAGVLKGKTYFYKVVPVVKNEAGAEVEGKASKVKSVKVK